MVAGAPGSAGAITAADAPPGCTAYIEGNRYKAVGSCDSSVTRAWRLSARIVCGFSAVRLATEYSLTSPKEMRLSGCRHYDPLIEFEPE